MASLRRGLKGRPEDMLGNRTQRKREHVEPQSVCGEWGCERLPLPTALGPEDAERALAWVLGVGPVSGVTDTIRQPTF